MLMYNHRLHRFITVHIESFPLQKKISYQKDAFHEFLLRLEICEVR